GMPVPVSRTSITTYGPAFASEFIAASGASDSGVEAEAAGAGVKHFLPKPYTAESLLRTLSKLLHPEA
ncbi:MAG: hybrid sensor histidine kinase/response regulator, partial [Chthoniobacteraceae bacterium]